MTRQARVGAAGGLAAALVTLTLSPLVAGSAWYLRCVLVVAGVSVAALVVRRVTARPPAALAAQLAALILALTWGFARDEAVWGLLPGPAVLDRMAALVTEGAQVMVTQGAPVEPRPGLVLLLAAGAGAVAVLVDLVSVWASRPAVAGLVLLGVYSVPLALAPEGTSVVHFALAAGGYLALLVSDAGDRVRGWGRSLRCDQGEEASPLGATARRVGALSVVAALVVPAVLPGLDRQLVGSGMSGFGLGRGGSTIDAINPILRLRENLGSRSEEVVLSFTTSQDEVQPLRIVTADSFDGEIWAPTMGPVPRGQRPGAGMPPPPGLADSVQTVQERTRIVVGDLDQTYLPLPYPTTRVDILGDWLYEADTLNVLGDDERTPGQRYTAVHLTVAPDPEILAQAAPAPAEIVERYTALPEDLPAVVAETAAEVAGTGTPYEQAVALQRFFRSEGGFRYSLDAPEDGGSDAVAAFLEQRRGFCVQFSSAMAVMARSLGIPARLAVGFLPGEANADGLHEISIADAHSWPELYFEGVGWMRFEPTPAVRAGGAPAWTRPPAPAAPPQEVPGAAAPSAAPQAPLLQPDGGQPAQDAGMSETPWWEEAWARVPWRAVGIAAVALLLAALPMAARRLTTAVRWRRASRSGTAVETAWTELGERVGDLWGSWPRTATPRQHEQALTPSLDAAGVQALARVARAVERSRYAATAGAPSDLRSDVEVVVQRLSARVPRAQRWQAVLLPRSGWRRIRAVGSVAGRALERLDRLLAGHLRGLGRALRTGRI